MNTWLVEIYSRDLVYHHFFPNTTTISDFYPTFPSKNFSVDGYLSARVARALRPNIRPVVLEGHLDCRRLACNLGGAPLAGGSGEPLPERRHATSGAIRANDQMLLTMVSLKKIYWD